MSALLRPKRKLFVPKGYHDHRRRHLPDARFPHIWVPRFIPARGAVAHDADATSFTTSAATTSLTFSKLTIGAISNGCLIVWVQFGGNPGAFTKQQWDSTGTPQTLTLITSAAQADNNAFSYLFGLVGPHTGNKTLALTWTNSIDYLISASSFSGVDQTGGGTTFKNINSVIATAGAGTSQLPITITSATGDMAVAGWASNLLTLDAVGITGTNVYVDNTNVSGGADYIAGAATVSPSLRTTSGSQDYVIVGCDLAAAVASTLNFGWNMRRPDDRPPPIALPPDEARQFFRPSQIPVPTRWLPTTGADRERLPPILDAPDEPPRQWFVRSPNPVPTSAPPTTGADKERLPPILRPSDEATPLFRSPASFLPKLLPTTGADRERLPPLQRAPDEATPFFARPTAQSVGISGIAWYNPGADKERLPSVGRPPDEATPFFARSPNVVPITWLPTTGAEDRPPPPSNVDQRWSPAWTPLFIVASLSNPFTYVYIYD